MTTTLTLRAVTPDEITALSNTGYSAYRHHFSAYWDSETELNAYLDSEYHPQVIVQSMENTGVSWFFICSGNTRLEVLENNTGARHFYQSQGMTVTGSLPFMTEQQSSRLLIMEKPL